MVVGVLKNFLGIEKEDINEDGEVIGGDITGDGMTTSDLGDYQYAPRLGSPVSVIPGQIIPVQVEIKKVKKKRKTNKKHRSVIIKLKESIELRDMDLDDTISDMIKYFCEKESLDPVEDAINTLNRYFGIAPSIFDDINGAI